ncbi:Uncharacterised protein [Mycobacterium tuberculosis]|uniref:Uncharacterized protein n=1 Tax=Mycobacterium tuberculosis TaxID=1773 RepID=A0A655A3I8_MYCTX|nr:Uncharacterised protein [Mycobacterium tuberculosis]CKR96589.1 Uncharacterised protein [Mycobacterium tuberculosis]
MASCLPKLSAVSVRGMPNAVSVATVDRHRLGQHGDLAAHRMPHMQVPIYRHDVGRDVVVARLTAVHDRVGLDEVPREQGIDAQVAAPAERRELGVFCAILIDHSHRMKTHRRLRMPVQVLYLLGQLQRIGPVIVAFAQCEVLATSGGQHILEIGVDTDVGLPQDRPKQLRIAGGVLSYDPRGGVRGGIVSDDHLDGELGPLGGEAVQGLANVLLLVVGDRDDTHLGRIRRCRVNHRALTLPRTAQRPAQRRQWPCGRELAATRFASKYPR